MGLLLISRPAAAKKRVAWAAGMLFVLTVGGAILSDAWIARAQGNIPDLKGTWVGDFSILRSQFPEKAGPDPLAFTKPGFRTAPKVKYVIDKQQGALFSGTESFAGSSEKFVGVIHFDNRTLSMVDRTGSLSGRIVAADTMHLIYTETGKHGMVAARGIVTRTKE
jgi:hypothetical protein